MSDPDDYLDRYSAELKNFAQRMERKVKLGPLTEVEACLLKLARAQEQVNTMLLHEIDELKRRLG